MKNATPISPEVLAEISQMSSTDLNEDLNLLVAKEVAAKLRIGKSTVYNLVNAGKLTASKIGGAVRFRPRALYACIRATERNTPIVTP